MGMFREPHDISNMEMCKSEGPPDPLIVTTEDNATSVSAPIFTIFLLSTISGSVK